jgi:hypothetical protein
LPRKRENASAAVHESAYHYAGTSSASPIIYPLNAVLQQMHPAQFPRIDLMPQFVWRIRDKATAPFAW